MTLIALNTDSMTPLSSEQETLDAAANVAEEIRVRGTVQGVGFRPTVYHLATACGLRGDVCNDGQGVLIRVGGSRAAIDQFLQRLQQEQPPLAQIDSIACQPLTVPLTWDDFRITESVSTHVHTEIAPDAATCPQCKAEILDPTSRWYRYPFTNCTHCGPRLSIVRAIPYDRTHTSMAAFPLCPACRREYHDVDDRRFHAQPVACPACGPQVWLESNQGKVASSDPINTVSTLLQQGAIVAIKGLGGIHLACDATNEAAVQRLRQRKHRYHKPFALMARDVAVIQRYCQVSAAEQTLLESPAAPIVLLQTLPTPAIPAIAPSVAPDMQTLGFMLPYTPLHHLILHSLDCPIVLTSGNRSDEPQCIDNEEAREKLSSIADYHLLHNREIVNRVDDSVVRWLDDRKQVLRRARGYAPAPIRLPAGFEQVPAILAMGSELKNTVCLVRDGEAILSQHLGDLENAAAFTAYQQTLALYLNLFEHQPTAIAVDRHPEYLSTKLGKELAEALPASDNHPPLQEIQHHHAHIAACLVENHWPIDAPSVLGIALDGLGYGEDGTLWGGEFLLADYRGYQRLAHFKPVAMLGGEQAIYQPWRNTYAHLMAALADRTESSLTVAWERLEQSYGELALVQFLKRQPRSLLNQLLVKGIQAPLASSSGRLFDAVAAALDLCREHCSYEGQGAIALEQLAATVLSTAAGQRHATEFAYPFALISPTPASAAVLLDPAPLWPVLLTDLQSGLSPAEIAARFHLGLAEAIATLVASLHPQHGFTHVALSGGVFQNAILHTQVSQRLTALGFSVLSHSQVPANDGGLSLGQGAIAAARLLARSQEC